MTATTIQEAAFHGSLKDAISEGAKTATESLKGVGRATEEMSKKVTGATPSLEQLNRRLDENSRLAAAIEKANRKHADTLAAIERERRAGLITETRALDLSERAVRLRDVEIEKARRQADAMRLMQGSYRETAGAAAACASANDNLARASALSHRQMQSLQAAAVNTFQSIAAGLPVGQPLITQAGQMAGAFGTLSVTTLAVGAGLLVVTGSAAGFARAMALAGDAVTATEGRRKIATGSLGAAHAAYERLHSIALQTGVAVSESAGGFVRFSLAARSIGATNNHVLALIGTVQKLAIASGATAQETTAATQKLGQASPPAGFRATNCAASWRTFRLSVRPSPRVWGCRSASCARWARPGNSPPTRCSRPS